MDEEKLLQNAIAKLPDMIDLIHIDRGDRLSDEQCQYYLDQNWDALDQELCEWEWAARESGATWAVQHFLTGDEREALEAAGLMGDFRDEIMGRDDSDPYGDMLRNTPDKLLTLDLGLDISGNANDDDRAEFARQLLAKLGLPESNLDKLIELTYEASYGARAKVIWYGDTAEAARASHATFTDPHLLLHDCAYGSGGDRQLIGTTKALDIEPGMVRLDAAGPGYTWDSIAGIYKPAYRTQIDFTKPKYVSELLP